MPYKYISEYLDGIRTGSIVVGEYIRLIYEYIVKKLDDGELIYDLDKADDAVLWIESHAFHTEGPLAPNALKLELWQKAMIATMFGVCDPETGVRQFREVVLIVSRKNGKSITAAAIAKYVAYKGGYGTRVFCIAPKLDQADIIYNSIWNMIQLDPEWQALKEATQEKDEHNKKVNDDSMLARHRQTDLCIPGLNTTIKKIAFSAKKSDGYNPSLSICDEIASWSGDQGLKQYEVMKSAMGAREMGDEPSILLSCSTSGYINDSIYDELIKRSTRFLLGESKESRLFPLLYMIDDVDKWNDIDELKKSNPNMGVSVSENYLKEEIEIAGVSLSKKAEFLTKYCNIKQNSSLAWLDTKTINRAYDDAPIDLEDFRGHYCVAGIDLSQTTDLTACCAVLEKHGELYIVARFFMPRERIEDAIARDNVPYNIYVQKGFLQLSGDNFVDYHDCFNWFTDLVEKYEIFPLKVGYDRYSAQYLVQDMRTYGFHMDDVFQGENLTPVIKEFEGTLRDGRIHIGNNDLLKMHFFNSALKVNRETNRVKLIKISPRDRIDGMAAVLDAFCVRQKWYSEIGDQLTNEVT